MDRIDHCLLSQPEADPPRADIVHKTLWRVGLRPRRTRLGRGVVQDCMWYVYILYSNKLKKFYVGSTTDLRKRVKEHNGKYSPFTSLGVPWRLVYYEAFIDKEDAQSEELFLKTGQGRERRKFLLRTFLDRLKI